MIYDDKYKNFLKNVSNVDLILTDPPHDISKEINLKDFSELSFKALRKGGTVIFFYDLWKITNVHTAFTSAGLKMIRLIIWEKKKPNKRFDCSYLNNSREVAVLGVKGGKPTFNSKYDNGVYNLPYANRDHPTQKPLSLISALIKKHSNIGNLIVDPFLGSETTAVASLRLKRKFKGYNINSEYVYVKKAKERI